MSLRDLWDQFGKMLYDVKSQARVHECSTEGLCFDESFYNDQQSEKNMEMDLVKVTRKYTEQEQKHMKREARRQSRLKSEFYSTTEISHPNDYIIDEPINIHTESEDECKESLLTSPEPTSVNLIITRKNQKRGRAFQGQSKRSTLHLRLNLLPSTFHCELKVHLVQEFLLK